MEQVSFFTAVSYGHQPKSFAQGLLEKVDDYFFLGGKKACVILGKKVNGCEAASLQHQEQSLVKTVLKIITYCTLILPGLLMGVKIVMRAMHRFYILPKPENQPAKPAEGFAFKVGAAVGSFPTPNRELNEPPKPILPYIQNEPQTPVQPPLNRQPTPKKQQNEPQHAAVLQDPLQTKPLSEWDQHYRQFLSTVSKQIPDNATPVERFALLDGLTSEVECFTKEEVGGRFSDIKCPKKSAVKIAGTVIHANHVHLDESHAICSQAPKVDIKDPHGVIPFWRAAMQHRAFILDLTNPKDQTRGVDPYYPTQQGKHVSFGSLTIACVRQEMMQNYPHITISEYEITDKDIAAKKTIHRINYSGWPDHNAVSAAELELILKHVAPFQKSKEPLTPLVHCRAGVGRTGTTVVAMALDKMIRKGEVTQQNYRNVIDALILTGRLQRGAEFVQQSVQYESLLQFVEGRLKV